MSGRTRLYQKAGSPLIQGDSKTMRPFWSVWFSGLAVGYVITVLTAVLLQWIVGGEYATASLADALLSSALWVSVIGLPGLALGSALGAWLGRNMGWRRTSISAGVMGALLALITIAVFLFALGFSLTAPV